MKVVLIYRQPAHQAVSIERVFRMIARNLPGVDVVEFVMSGRARLLSDVRSLRRLNADIYHVTGDVYYVVPMLPNGRTVLTFHDIGHYLFGLRGVKRLLYKWIWLALPLRSVSAVVCASSETARNVKINFEVAEHKFHIIDDCLTAEFIPSVREFNYQKPRILQVGTKPYKNVPRLIYALAGISCTLVLVGEIDDPIRDALNETEVSIEGHAGITDAALLELYQTCDMVTFVSTGEGFGLPIIEAQAAARPLLTSNVSPLCDVAGLGACLVDPLDVISIREGLRKIIDDNKYRHSLVRHGLANVSRFSPATIAGKYRKIYDALLFARGRAAW